MLSEIASRRVERSRMDPVEVASHVPQVLSIQHQRRTLSNLGIEGLQSHSSSYRREGRKEQESRVQLPEGR